MGLLDWVRWAFGYEKPRPQSAGDPLLAWVGWAPWGASTHHHPSTHHHRWCEYRTVTDRPSAVHQPSSRVLFSYWRHCLDCGAKEWRGSRTGNPFEGRSGPHVLCDQR